jgi:putative transposase
MRVTRSREPVAEGDRPSVVARVAQISRQAIDRVPKPGRAPASPTRPPVEEVEAAIVAVAEANPTDGYRPGLRVGAPAARPAREPQAGAARDARAAADRRRRPVERRRRPGVFRVERPDQLWHLDLTSVWVAEHGWL